MKRKFVVGREQLYSYKSKQKLLLRTEQFVMTQVKLAKQVDVAQGKIIAAARKHKKNPEGVYPYQRQTIPQSTPSIQKCAVDLRIVCTSGLSLDLRFGAIIDPHATLSCFPSLT